MTITINGQQERVNLQAKLYGVPLVSSFAQADALSKLLSERHHHATGISREDFRRASDISVDV
jgi:hypothetical protein